MGKVVSAIATVAAFVVGTIVTQNPWTGLQIAGAVGGGMGVLTQIINPPKQRMAEQEGIKHVVRNPVDTRKIVYGKAKLAGTEIFIEEFDTNESDDFPNDRLVFSRVVADHPIKKFGQFWLADEKIDFAADAHLHTSNSGAAITEPYTGEMYLRTFDGNHTSWDGNLIWATSKYPAGQERWTEQHIGKGVSYFTIRANYDQEIFPYGASIFEKLAVEVEGKPIYDPRKDSTYVGGGSGSQRLDDPTTWEYSTNPALCIYDYLRDDVLGNPVPNDEINVESIVTAANICDEQVSVAVHPEPGSGGTKTQAAETISRFTFNGVVDSGHDKFSNIQTMLSAMGGRLMWLGGEVHIFAAAERTATDLLDENVIVSAQYDPAPPADSRYNEVHGTYISAEDNYQQQEYPAHYLLAFRSDEGERALPLNLPYTQDHRTAQHLARIALMQSRQPTLRLEVVASAMRFAPMDVVRVSWTNFSMEGEEFRIIEQRINPGSNDAPVTVSMTLVREEPSVYDWDWQLEEPRGQKPPLSLTVPKELPAPTGVTISAVTLTSEDNSKETSLQVGWDLPHATVLSTQVYYRLKLDAIPGDSPASGQSLGWKLKEIVPWGDTDALMLLPSALPYEVRLRHVYLNGKMSAFAYGVGTTDTLPGVARMVNRGKWNASAQYEISDLVIYQGSSYYCVARPPIGTAPTNTSYWALLASVGGYRDIRFRRSVSRPATPTGVNPSGWSDGPPIADGNPLWMSTVHKTFEEELIGDWTVPEEIGGSGLEVQYSPYEYTGWHNPPFQQNNDNYMRQKLSGETGWSQPMRIVGEKGQDGSVWFTGFGRPWHNIPSGAKIKDFYVDQNDLNVYEKTGSGASSSNWHYRFKWSDGLGALALLEQVNTNHIADEAVTDLGEGSGSSNTFETAEDGISKKICTLYGVRGAPEGALIVGRVTLSNNLATREIAIQIRKSGASSASGEIITPVTSNARTFTLFAHTDSFSGSRTYELHLRSYGTSQDVNYNSPLLKYETAKK